MTEEITPAELRRLIRYDRSTGDLFWKHRPRSMFADCKQPNSSYHSFKSQYAMRPALVAHKDGGYRYGLVMGIKHYAHRVAYCLHYGRWPEGLVDHIDRDPSNNRIKNLRDTNYRTNSRNQTLATNNTSGTRGVSWMYKAKSWRARITVDGRQVSLGAFKDKQDAINARLEAERKYMGFNND